MMWQDGMQHLILLQHPATDPHRSLTQQPTLSQHPPMLHLAALRHPLRRGVQPLPGRGLGAHVGGVAEGGRRPRERDGEHGGQGEETAHPAGLRV